LLTAETTSRQTSQGRIAYRILHAKAFPSFFVGVCIQRFLALGCSLLGLALELAGAFDALITTWRQPVVLQWQIRKEGKYIPHQYRVAGVRLLVEIRVLFEEVVR
jgi:hypothetical protein